MSKIDLYPNPGLVEAIRKDGYNKFGFDVFLVAYADNEGEGRGFDFIFNAIQATDKALNILENMQKNDTLYYKTYSNTVEYLLEYYNFLIKNNLVRNVYSVGAKYMGGIVQDYIEAVNSKKPVLFTTDDDVYYNASPPEFPTEISSWISKPKLINYYDDHALLIYAGGPKQDLKRWVYNMILFSMVEGKGFNYSSQLMFMNWKGNPLNR